VSVFCGVLGFAVSRVVLVHYGAFKMFTSLILLEEYKVTEMVVRYQNERKKPSE